MNNETTYKACPRCEAENHTAHNFCWLCGLQLEELVGGRSAPGQNQTRNVVAASVGTGVLGIFAGAAGGIVVGVMIVMAVIGAILNWIGEMLDSCSGTLVFMALASYGVIHSVIHWLF